MGVATFGGVRSDIGHDVVVLAYDDASNHIDTLVLIVPEVLTHQVLEFTKGGALDGGGADVRVLGE